MGSASETGHKMQFVATLVRAHGVGRKHTSVQKRFLLPAERDEVQVGGKA